LVAKALKEVLKEAKFNGDTAWLKDNFSFLVEAVNLRAYYLYIASEGPACGAAMAEVFGEMMPDKPSKDQFFKVLADNFIAIDKFFLSLTQGRRQRAGSALEQVIATLFDQLEYPYVSQPKIDGQPDFLFPSLKRYQEMPMDCIVFTAKRTLRERWRQITTEGNKGLHFYLATLDEELPESALSEMLRNRIYIVVPKRVKDEFYPKAQNALSSEAFMDEMLDPAMKRWKKNKVI
jgi:hypothetical protein